MELHVKELFYVFSIRKKVKGLVTVKKKEKYQKINNNHSQNQQNDC